MCSRNYGPGELCALHACVYMTQFVPEDEKQGQDKKESESKTKGTPCGTGGGHQISQSKPKAESKMLTGKIQCINTITMNRVYEQRKDTKCQRLT